MAAEQFIDLDTLDLSQVAMSKEQLDEILPQSGHMRQIDHLIWINQELSICVSIRRVLEEEFWVPGHIPGRPLMPGVLMIEAAAQTSSVLYRLRNQHDKFVGFTRCDDVVFRGQVAPGDVVYFISKELEFRQRRFITLNQAVLNGKLIFEGQVTGMQL